MRDSAALCRTALTGAHGRFILLFPSSSLVSEIMQLAAALSPVWDLISIIKIAFIPALVTCLHEPTTLLHPHALIRVFMAAAWAGGFADAVDEGGKPVKDSLITPHSYGTVLDLGAGQYLDSRSNSPADILSAGHGHSARYFDRTKVTRYVALEPNTIMHPHIRKAAADCGYHESDGSLIILSCGAEDSASILTALDNAQVDTIVSVLTLCTVPNPEKTVHNLVRDVLKPGGTFLFYEHVLSHHADVAWWQRLWAPIWEVPFDGCRLDRPTHLWVSNLKVEGVSPWKEQELRGKPDEVEENLFWHRVGRFVKN